MFQQCPLMTREVYDVVTYFFICPSFQRATSVRASTDSDAATASVCRASSCAINMTTAATARTRIT